MIDAADVALIRRIIHGAGGEGGSVISRTEAELLFDLNDRTATGENDPAWGELFVKAITMHVLFGGGSPTGSMSPRRAGWPSGSSATAAPTAMRRRCSAICDARLRPCTRR